jgi:hypothetical protein
MLREIKRIIPLSAAKLAAVIYGAMGVVVGFPIALATVLPSIIHGREAGTSLSLLMITVIVLAILIIVPLFYALLGFIIGVVGAAIYNLFAKCARRIASRS